MSEGTATTKKVRRKQKDVSREPKGQESEGEYKDSKQ